MSRARYGSIGYNYDWKLAEAQKNLMRTHTTAVSSRMLYKLAQEGFQVRAFPAAHAVVAREWVGLNQLMGCSCAGTEVKLLWPAVKPALARGNLAS